MQTITYPTKVTGDELTAAEVNMIKTVVNANAVDVLKQIYIPAYQMHLGATTPPVIELMDNTPLLKFYPEGDHCFFHTKLPDDYKAGTPLFIQLFGLLPTIAGASFSDEYAINISIVNITDDTPATDRILNKYQFGVDVFHSVTVGDAAKTILLNDYLDASITSVLIKPGALISGEIVLTEQGSAADPYTQILGLAILYTSDKNGGEVV